MTVNIISDIHASYDPALGQVMYNAPLDYPEEALKKALLKFVWDVSVLSKKRIEELKPLFERTKRNISPKDASAWLSQNANLLLDAVSKPEMLDNENVFVCTEFIRNASYVLREAAQKGWQFISNGESNRIIVASDLMTYLWKKVFDFDPKKLKPADYLIIAGDLGHANTYLKVLSDIQQKTAGSFKKILHIAGNHDYWFWQEESPNKPRPDSICNDFAYSLHHDNEYVFIGCTLWTPILDYKQRVIQRCMNDYRHIPGKFSTYYSNELYRLQSSWLKKTLKQNAKKKAIVFTHHQPFGEMTDNDLHHNGHDGWDSVDVSMAYSVKDHSLDDIASYGDIKLWACGHSHVNFDDELHGVHAVRNPIGYRDNYGCIYLPAENGFSGTWYNKIVEV